MRLAWHFPLDFDARLVEASDFAKIRGLFHLTSHQGAMNVSQ